MDARGFTLVELIVVIVIVLILAAALVPNVMRYIDQARRSAFQAEADAYLVELQGFEAECYAENDADLSDIASGSDTYWKTKSYTLSGGIGDPTFLTVAAGGGYEEFSVGSGSTKKSFPLKDGTKVITVYVKDGVVSAFGFADGVNWVSWQQDKGWANVNAADPWS